jgi:hypothetical protein
MKWRFQILVALALGLALLARFTPHPGCDDDGGRDAPRLGSWLPK